MDFIEFTGKTVDDALTNALVEFGEQAIRLSMKC